MAHIYINIYVKCVSVQDSDGDGDGNIISAQSQ